jgi:glutathione S-transferase
MILYGHDTSPYVRRVRVLLAEKGLPFDRDADSWVNPSAAVLRLNPMLRVPALVDEGQALLDSKLIATYLCERYPQPPPPPPAGHLPLQPTQWHPEHRWDDENTLLAIDAAVDSAINVFLLELDGIAAERAPYLGRQQTRLRSCLTWLDGKLAAGPTFHPGVFAPLDIALMCALQWLQFRNRYPVQEHAALSRFVAAHAARPSLATTHPALAQGATLPKTPTQ